MALAAGAEQPEPQDPKDSEEPPQPGQAAVADSPLRRLPRGPFRCMALATGRQPRLHLRVLRAAVASA